MLSAFVNCLERSSRQKRTRMGLVTVCGPQVRNMVRLSPEDFEGMDLSSARQACVRARSIAPLRVQPPVSKRKHVPALYRNVVSTFIRSVTAMHTMCRLLLTQLCFCTYTASLLDTRKRQGEHVL